MPTYNMCVFVCFVIILFRKHTHKQHVWYYLYVVEWKRKAALLIFYKNLTKTHITVGIINYNIRISIWNIIKVLLKQKRKKHKHTNTRRKSERQLLMLFILYTRLV